MWPQRIVRIDPRQRASADVPEELSPLETGTEVFDASLRLASWPLVRLAAVLADADQREAQLRLTGVALGIMAINGLLTRQVSHEPVTAYSARVTRPAESERSSTRARHSLARAGPTEREDRACHHAKTISRSAIWG